MKEKKFGSVMGGQKTDVSLAFIPFSQDILTWSAWQLMSVEHAEIFDPRLLSKSLS